MSQAIKQVIFLVSLCFALVLAIFLLKVDNYLLSSMLIAIIGIIPFYYKYDHQKVEAREVVIVALLVAIAVLTRLAFAWLPSFKPVVCIVIISGAVYKKEVGFLVGSLTALVSGFFFGQGMWTIYQMFIWGLFGYLAGLLNIKGIIDNIVGRIIYAGLCGILFSMMMDFLTCLSSGYTNEKFIALLIAAGPFYIYYALSNIIFIILLYKPLTKKLKRIKVKYGIK
ncbi:MAG: ECF transporter S component [Bacilli bacterium]|jgi:energy-coupling factor transport system substrate-specific component|nr:ECF transporter S component [Bacilli bacterium]